MASDIEPNQKIESDAFDHQKQAGQVHKASADMSAADISADVPINNKASDKVEDNMPAYIEPSNIIENVKSFFTLARLKEELKFFATLLASMFALLTLIWGHFKIPSESMLPTLEVGDHLYVSKFAYGYSRHSLPFGLHDLAFLPDGKIFSQMPKRGDVAVFRNPKIDLIMIKRVVGLPKDKIRILRGRVYVNDQIVPRENIDNYLYRQHSDTGRGIQVGVDVYEEKLPLEKHMHQIYEQTDFSLLDNTQDFFVPEGHIFFMGDNRDNSADSRDSNGPGMVPLDHLIGRADFMMFSFKRCDKEPGLRCPPMRFLKPL